MHAVHCPQCDNRSPRLLETLSLTAKVDYYRCDGCGHVWTTRKGTPDTVHHVTPFKNQMPHRPFARMS